MQALPTEEDILVKIKALSVVDSGIADELSDRLQACQWLVRHLNRNPEHVSRLQTLMVRDLEGFKAFRAEYVSQLKKEFERLYGKEIDSTAVLGACYFRGTLADYQLKRLVHGPNVHSRIRPDEDSPFLDTTPA